MKPDDYQEICDIIKKRVQSLSNQLDILCSTCTDAGGTWHSFEKWLTTELFCAFSSIENKNRFFVLPEPMYRSYRDVVPKTETGRDSSIDSSMRADLLIADVVKKADCHDWGVIVEVAVVHPHNVSQKDMWGKIISDIEKLKQTEKKENWSSFERKEYQPSWGKTNFEFMQVLVLCATRETISKMREWIKEGDNKLVNNCWEPPLKAAALQEGYTCYFYRIQKSEIQS